MFFFAAFQSDMWRKLFLAVPHGMENIGRQVQQTVLGIKADSTVRSYLCGFKRLKRWTSYNEIPSIPTNLFQVAVDLQCLINEANSPLPIQTAVYSIDWATQLAGLPKNSDHPLISGLIGASHRILGRSTNKKERVTPEMLKALVQAGMTDKCLSLSDLRMFALC